MTLVTPFLSADFFRKLQDQATAQGVAMLRGIIAAVLPKLLPYLPLAIAILFALLMIASIKALFGQIGMLGSLIYHILYFGIFGMIIWINGLEILLSVYFDIICAVLYPICYWLTGVIRNKLISRY